MRSTRARSGAFADARTAFTSVLGTFYAGWGDSWVDLDNDGKLDLVLANGAIPVTNLAKDASPIRVIAQLPDGHFAEAGLKPRHHVNGRGLAAADYDNDGRVDVAVNTIGGKLVLLHNTGPVGHWLEVNVRPFSPGALVTVLGRGARGSCGKCRRAAATSRRRIRACTSGSAPPARRCR